ncbi:MAG: sortase [Bryobacterales bacterium]|nr:sortase [Bryobacterales bacterium]
MSRRNILSLLMIASGLALLGWWLFQREQLEETIRSTREWLRAANATPAASPVWLSPDRSLRLPASQPLGMLSIARIHLKSPVFAGTDERTLSRAAGWIKGTAPPGSAGNVGIAAHRDTLFRPLRNIKPGDEVDYYSPSGVHVYQVVWTRIVKPSDVYVLDGTKVPSLTLVSCYPFYYIGSAPYRFIVRAEAVGGRESP